MRGKILTGTCIGSLAVVAAMARDSRACGGCFIRPTTQVGTVVTDHRMIFAVSPTQTTLYDQIRYSGSPSEFAWVLPIHGPVKLGVSSDQLFSVLDQNTQTTVRAPPYPCPVCNCVRNAPVASGGASYDAGIADGGGVTVIAQQVVGPYATVQLHPNSTSDTAALTSWLKGNSYDIPVSIEPIIAAYVQEGFDFLAIKLVPGQGVQAMRPISVTTSGSALSLPLRMVAAGTGATVGITLWVVGTGRYEPQNFQSFTIDPSSLVWDWSTSSSNYTALRAQKELLLNYAAWQVESSLDVSLYSIESPVLADPSASAYIGVPAQDGGVGLTAIEARSQDLNTLFPSGGAVARITRLRADLSQAALATDLVLQASMDQKTLSNVYQATLSTNANCSPCPCGSTSGSSGAPFGGSAGSTAGSTSGFGPSGNGGQGSSAGATPGGTGTSSGHANGTSPSNSQGGCAAAPSAPPGVGLFAALAALIGSALLRARSRKRS
jgi:hypothetical protein